MSTPNIVRFENHTPMSFDVVINCDRQDTASHFARDYFADENNRLEYLWSDFDCNHAYRVTLR